MPSHWIHLNNSRYSPYLKVNQLVNLTTCAKSLLSCKVTYSQRLGHGLLGGHYSPHYSSPSSPQRFMSVSHAKYIHFLPRSLKVSSHYSIKLESKKISYKSYQVQSPKSHYLKVDAEAALGIILPRAQFLPSVDLRNYKETSHVLPTCNGGTYTG